MNEGKPNVWLSPRDYETHAYSLTVICHGVPDQRPLEDGDILNLDVSCYYKGFHGDCNATYLVGNVDDAGKKLVQVTKECLDLAIAAGNPPPSPERHRPKTRTNLPASLVKPGARYRDFGKIIEDHATKNGFSVVRAFCGHGINQLFHCLPNVHHYASKSPSRFDGTPFVLLLMSLSHR